MPETFANIDIKSIHPSATNPRRTFDPAKMAELTASIKEKGIIQPVIVRSQSAGKDQFYELVAGERRYRAALEAGLAEVPAMVRELSDIEVLELQVIENDQREDVDPLEQAEGYKRLLTSGYSIETIALKTGHTKAYVLGRVKLGDLDKEGRKKLEDGHLTLGAAFLLAQVGENAKNFWVDNAWQTKITEDTVRRWLQNYYPEVASFPFDLNDKKLVPKAGSCMECAKNTGVSGDLFDESADPTKGQCMDKVCMSKKIAAHVRKLTDARPEMLLISNEKKKGTFHRYELDLADENADPEIYGSVGVIVDGRDVAKVVRFKPREDPGESRRAEYERETEERKSKFETEARFRDAAYSHLLSESAPSVPYVSLALILLGRVWATLDAKKQKTLAKRWGWAPVERTMYGGKVEKKYDLECFRSNPITTSDARQRIIEVFAEIDLLDSSGGFWFSESNLASDLLDASGIASAKFKADTSVLPIPEAVS